ncbi:MAG: Rv1355c family protein [Saprospiraceae bacterium]|nr:Rv1355c family protein [Saprospiraceae bacterium]
MDAVYKPIILDLNDESDALQYQEYCKNERVVVLDTIYVQLKELVKLRNPKITLTEPVYDQLIAGLLNGVPIERYGKWIFYPWLNKLIHTVHEDEFVEIRTVRNKYKITKEEQDVLAGKVIGIVGLSVGHAIALTAASERICRKLKIADFDTLELTNLNRIKTGIENLGLKKTIIAAREIAEIDPFIEVECFHDGIHDGNIDDFLLGNSRLDVLIEECDDFFVKFKIRYQCKAYGIPVVMDTSDRGLLDVERFDLEPERKVFHGLSTVSDLNKLRNLSMEQKIPYLYEILNEKTMSDRFRASLIEIDETITGWPQLSSAVTYGSGMTVDIVRKILLGQFTNSGRYSVDLDKIFVNAELESPGDQPSETLPLSAEAAVDHWIPQLVGQPLEIDLETVKKIVSSAILAPSGGNNQPWKWVFSGGSLFVFLDKTRCSPYTDYNYWGSTLSLGCAVENAVLAADHHGYAVKVQEQALGDHDFGIELKLTEKASSGNAAILPDLYDYIQFRQCNRKNAEYRPLNPEHKAVLLEALRSVPGADAVFIEDRGTIERLKELVAESDILRFLNKNLFREMMHEIRWTKEEAVKMPYGVELDSFEISAKEKVGFKIAGSWDVASIVKKIGGRSLGDISRKQIAQSSAMVLITMPKISSGDFFNGGRALERFWLTATKNRIAVHPMVPLCYFFMRLRNETDDCFDRKELLTLNKLRGLWNDIFPAPRGDAEVFMLRLFYADPVQDMSQRIPVEQVLTFK